MARAATAPARPRTAPAPRTRPAPQPRRRSGAAVPTRAPRRRRRTAPWIARVLEAPIARMLDALLLGRTWIVLIGVLLTGIVFFNVSLLGLNQGITRDSERAQALEQQNTQLRLQVAELASSERIQQLAAKKGMVMPAAGAVGYLRSRVRTDARRAAARVVAPGTGQLAAGSTAPGRVVQPAVPAATVPSASSTAQPTTTAPTTP